MKGMLLQTDFAFCRVWFFIIFKFFPLASRLRGIVVLIMIYIHPSFILAPGYRWDGIDRSNGFEAKLYLKQNAQSAQDVDAYRWSTENM